MCNEPSKQTYSTANPFSKEVIYCFRSNRCLVFKHAPWSSHYNLLINLKMQCQTFRSSKLAKPGINTKSIQLKMCLSSYWESFFGFKLICKLLLLHLHSIFHVHRTFVNGHCVERLTSHGHILISMNIWKKMAFIEDISAYFQVNRKLLFLRMPWVYHCW